MVDYVRHGALYRSASFGNDAKLVGARFLEELAMVLFGYVKSLKEKSVMFSNMYIEIVFYV